MHLRFVPDQQDRRHSRSRNGSGGTQRFLSNENALGWRGGEQAVRDVDWWEENMSEFELDFIDT
jgi:hypothetical protein